MDIHAECYAQTRAWRGARLRRASTRPPALTLKLAVVLSEGFVWDLGRIFIFMDNASFMDIYGAIFMGQRPWGRKSVTRKRERGAGPAFGGPLHGRQLSRLNWRSCCRKVL